ncbi:ATPase [Zafaria cholistanensis]|uniref:ATPase n=1 Tax=Zafaria cholistanensis TaxID=1682741 RepID=A0A5A7NN84_9MICC|nr:ATPase [Zafaria cholistanensis]
MDLGAALTGGELRPEAQVRLPLRMMNRHGLVAGATGTGKTVTLQVMAEQLSAAGVPVFLADIKGDLSGLAVPGSPTGKLLERTRAVGQDWVAQGFPVEFLALGGDGAGVPVRATVASFGPLLLSRVMDLNETQESSLQLVFHYADQKDLELYDLKDLRAVISHLASAAGRPELEELGGLSKATAGVLLRELVNLEAQGLAGFFGEPEFNTAELLRTAPDGRGVITCLELPTLLQKPLLFSTFLMWLLADLFAELPEVGDADRPRLVFFLDEAHLLFRGASKAFLEAVAATVRLIRSKGVGVFFVTQTPKDVPEEVLGQLANRIQHALRAFTPDDARALRATVSTFPVSDYDLAEALTTAGTGEAIVTVMNERGAPAPVAWTRMRSPVSRMGPAPAGTIRQVVAGSPLLAAYGTAVDRASALEKLKGAAPAPPRDRAPAQDLPGKPVGGGLPGSGQAQDQAQAQAQAQAQIDAEARRIEEDILGRPSSRPVPVPRDRSPRPEGGPDPLVERVLETAIEAAGAMGQELLRGMFQTRRRRRR